MEIAAIGIVAVMKLNLIFQKITLMKNVNKNEHFVRIATKWDGMERIRSYPNVHEEIFSSELT